MAKVTIRRTWPEGEALSVSIEVDESFPDVVAEARQAALRTFEGAMEVELAAAEAVDEDTGE
jgi:hypothetical protein